MDNNKEVCDCNCDKCDVCEGMMQVINGKVVIQCIKCGNTFCETDSFDIMKDDGIIEKRR